MITLVDYMTNNSVVESAVGDEPFGLKAEVLLDTTGAIDFANKAGSAAAQ